MAPCREACSATAATAASTATATSVGQDPSTVTSHSRTTIQPRRSSASSKELAAQRTIANTTELPTRATVHELRECRSAGAASAQSSPRPAASTVAPSPASAITTSIGGKVTPPSSPVPVWASEATRPATSPAATPNATRAGRTGPRPA